MTGTIQEATYSLVFMPYIGLDGISSIRIGQVRLVNAETFIPTISDEAMRNRIRAILNMHRVSGRSAGKSMPIDGIGILCVGQPDFREFTEAEEQLLRDFRSILFLSCLAQNNRMAGPNAGHFVFTSENFDIREQKFDLARDFMAVTSGTLVRTTHLGLTIAETQFFRPPYVLHPRFRTDVVLLQQLDWLRQRQLAFYRRILRATAVFIESYYNAENVDIRARILLQASTFEILFDLPEQGQRKAFKDRIEHLTKIDGERRINYTFEMWDKKHQKMVRKPETRTIKAMWADRFYTLRNHIIHGNSVHASEYNFRGQQHHVFIAPLFFVQCIKQLIDELRVSKGRDQVFTDRLEWIARRKTGEDDSDGDGFSVDTDFYKHHLLHEARQAHRQRRRDATTVEVKEGDDT